MKIISRAAAKAAGLQYYYEGTPCKRGHIEQYYVSSGGCVECAKESKAKRTTANPLYGTWWGMCSRCTDENSVSYPRYGGRGVRVCDRWLDPENGYENFVSDMGPRPTGFTLDRIDNDGDYEPANCRWADHVTQCRNRRTTKLKGEDVLEAFRLRDAGLTIYEIGRRLGCTGGNIWNILQNRERYVEQGLGRGTQKAA